MTERVDSKLFDAVCPLNHKAQTGLAIAMTEFIYWRLYEFCEKKNIELTTSFSLVEIWTKISSGSKYYNTALYFRADIYR